MRRHRWFLPETPDVLGMLREQTAITIEGMEALVAWADGDRAPRIGCASASTEPTTASASCARR